MIFSIKLIQVLQKMVKTTSRIFKILILVVFLLWVVLTRYNRRRWGGSGWIDDLKYSAKKDGLTFAKWKYF